jgi:hypothetical protein
LLRAGLAAATAIANEKARAEALAALAPYSTGELLETGLVAATAIAHEELRAQVLTAFLPLAPDRAGLLRAIRLAVTDHVWNNLAHEDRAALLSFCADAKLFAPPVLSPDTLAAIVRHIIEICQEWEWL